jgi:hypothetical protein
LAGVNLFYLIRPSFERISEDVNYISIHKSGSLNKKPSNI